MVGFIIESKLLGFEIKGRGKETGEGGFFLLGFRTAGTAGTVGTARTAETVGTVRTVRTNRATRTNKLPVLLKLFQKL